MNKPTPAKHAMYGLLPAEAVCVIRTDEERMIAGTVCRVLGLGSTRKMAQ